MIQLHEETVTGLLCLVIVGWSLAFLFLALYLSERKFSKQYAKGWDSCISDLERCVEHNEFLRDRIEQLEIDGEEWKNA